MKASAILVSLSLAVGSMILPAQSQAAESQPALLVKAESALHRAGDATRQVMHRFASATRRALHHDSGPSEEARR